MYNLTIPSVILYTRAKKHHKLLHCLFHKYQDAFIARINVPVLRWTLGHLKMLLRCYLKCIYTCLVQPQTYTRSDAEAVSIKCRELTVNTQGRTLTLPLWPLNLPKLRSVERNTETSDTKIGSSLSPIYLSITAINSQKRY